VPLAVTNKNLPSITNPAEGVNGRAARMKSLKKSREINLAAVSLKTGAMERYESKP
jgi:hypothetical protein